MTHTAEKTYEPGQEVFLTEEVLSSYHKSEFNKMRGRRAFVVRTYARLGEELTVVLNFQKATPRQREFQKFFMVSTLRRMESASEKNIVTTLIPATIVAQTFEEIQ